MLSSFLVLGGFAIQGAWSVYHPYPANSVSLKSENMQKISRRLKSAELNSVACKVLLDGAVIQQFNSVHCTAKSTLGLQNTVRGALQHYAAQNILLLQNAFKAALLQFPLTILLLQYTFKL